MLKDGLRGEGEVDAFKVEQREAGKDREKRAEGYPFKSIGAATVTSIFLSAVICFMINYLAGRHYRRFDWTPGGYFTLSDETKKILKSLNRRVNITVFISTGSALYSDLKEIISRYSAYSTNIVSEFVDPDIDPARFELMQKKYNVRGGKLPDGQEVHEQVVVVSSADHVKFVTIDEMTEFEFDQNPYSTAPSLKSFKAEQSITSAILNVTEKESTKVCFTEGHGEWSVDRFDERGIGHVEELLRRYNYKVKTISLKGRNKVPPDCKLVIVAGVERPFLSSEAEKLKSYFEDGGNLLLFLDPLIDGTRFVPCGLEGLLEFAGIELRRAVVVEGDERRLLPISGVGMETFVSSDYEQHPITDPIEGLPTLFRIVVPLSKAEEQAEVELTPLVRTSEKSWGETDLEGIVSSSEPEKTDSDISGPLIVAYAGVLKFFKSQEEGDSKNNEKRQEAKGRIVVFGDSDMLYSDLFNQLTFVNQEMVMGSIAWLTQRPSLISIPPKNPEKVKLNLTRAQIKNIIIWIMVNLPLLVIVVGVFIWWRRKR